MWVFHYINKTKIKNNYNMIYLENDTVNLVPLTLNESDLISATPSFIFEFIREWDNNIGTYSYTDISNTNVFNLFEITISSTASATQPTIDDPINLLSGQYIYKVYDSNNNNSLLENGMLVVESISISDMQNNIYL